MSAWQRRFQSALPAFLAGAIAVVLLLRATGIDLLLRGIFVSVLVLAAVPTLLWWSWMDQLVAEASLRSRNRRRLRVLVGAYGLLMLLPLLLFRWHIRDVLPLPLLAWVMVWHMLMIVVGLVVLGAWIVRAVGRVPQAVRWALSRGRGRSSSQPDSQPAGRYSCRIGSTWHQGWGVVPIQSRGTAAGAEGVGAPGDPPADMASPTGLSRRSFLTTTLALAPVVLVGGATAWSMAGQGRFAVRRVRMLLPRLPQRLRGLTITQVSDIHVGRLFRPEHLGGLVDAVNRLDSDLLAITGDAVDHSVDHMPAVCEAFAQMRSRYGRYFVIGNHDLIDSPRQALEYLRGHEPNFLEDECRIVEIGGERVQVAGLFWSRREQTVRNSPGYVERALRTLGKADPGLFTIALAHHPHAFDTLADGGVDLTLAGHTHGGQLMLTPPGAAQPIGAGNLLFRYIWGEYWRAGRALYVTSGAGNWFPVRVNAPAEIVQIQLI